MSRQVEQLVKMAEQIALNLAPGHDDIAAARRTAQHIGRFWTPAMCRRLIEYWRGGGAVSPLVARALEQADHNRSETL